MVRFLARRAVHLVFVLVAISSLLFFLLRLSGDPAAVLAGPNASPEVIAAIRKSMGFDQPLLVQYGRFMGDTLQLHFGDSLASHQDAMGIVLSRLPATIELILAGFALAIVVGIPLGVLAAVRPRARAARSLMLVTLLGQSIPVFWLGILLILLFSVRLHWLPSAGAGDPRSLVLPAVTLAVLLTAKIVRLVRSSVLEVLQEDYVRTAHAKGLSPFRIHTRHVLRNGLTPVITIIGVDLAQSLGGAVLIETIFSWPGIGRQMLLSVAARDYPVVQATVFIVAIVVVAINLGVDVLYRTIDPRVRLGQ
jgi:ABC-type dipeptide/oligopeptide/nickel transport system permease component